MWSIAYSYAQSKNNIAHPLTRCVLPYEEFVRQFGLDAFVSARTKTALPIWSPAIYRGVSRVASDVIGMSAFVADIDSLSVAELEAHTARWAQRGLEYIIHSSYSYAPPDKAKVRAIFPFRTLLPIRTQWEWSDCMWPRLTAHLCLTGILDIACKDTSRGYFMPASAAGAPRLARQRDGALLDPHTLLADVLAAPDAQFDFHRDYVDREDPSRAIDIASLAQRLRGKFRSGKLHDVVERVLRAERLPDGVSRHPVVCDFTRALAIVATPEEASERLLEIMLPWLDAMRAHGEQRDWRTEALSALRGAREKLPSWEARYAHEQQTRMPIRAMLNTIDQET